MTAVGIGYVAAWLMGMTLGIFGGGGSILTVPILVYLFRVSPLLATTYSLFVVGLTSSIGVLASLRQKLIQWKIALSFALPSFCSIYYTRSYLIPALPETLFESPFGPVTRDFLIMFLFAIIMILAASMMIRSAPSPRHSNPTSSVWILPLVGLGVGAITGLIGAGGGFLIVPGLVLFGKLPIRESIATSMLIVMANSFFGFFSSLPSVSTLDGRFLIQFSLLPILGILIGSSLRPHIPTFRLKKAFGYFILVMGALVLIKELFFL